MLTPDTVRLCRVRKGITSTFAAILLEGDTCQVDVALEPLKGATGVCRPLPPRSPTGKKKVEGDALCFPSLRSEKYRTSLTQNPF